MKIVITRNTFVRGVPYIASPNVVELENSIARDLVAMGKACIVEGERGQELAGDDKPSKPLPEMTPDLKNLPIPLRAKVKPKKERV